MEEVNLTPMEIQAMQTREFDADKKVAFGAVMSVIQDLGFTVSGADLETGFIQAAGQSRSDRWTIGEQLFIFAISDEEIDSQYTVENEQRKVNCVYRIDSKWGEQGALEFDRGNPLFGRVGAKIRPKIIGYLKRRFTRTPLKE